MTVKECIARVYSQGGIAGFYKGITASYFGICETMIHFVIYEFIKSKLVNKNLFALWYNIDCLLIYYYWFQIERQNLRSNKHHSDTTKTSRDFLEFMMAGAISKTVASCIAYPHEVARTRLREEGSKYNKFWQTLYTVWKEEGRAGLYRYVDSFMTPVCNCLELKI